MCGRFTLATNPAEYAEDLGEAVFPEQFQPRYNIAPSQPVLAVSNDSRGKAGFFVWGLIPSWAKDPTIGNRLINARGETLGEKPAFRGAYKYKRCIIPADGFYEWKALPSAKVKVPHYIRLKSHKPFALAGLWDQWDSPDGSTLRTCTIVTTEANTLMAPIHNRMPVILAPETIADWLDAEPRSPQSLSGLVRPYAGEMMESYAVSTLVNSPANDRVECITAA